MDGLDSSLVVALVASASSALVAGVSVWLAARRSRSTRLESEQMLIRHRELSLDLICTASFNGHFVQLSPSWTQVLGYEIDELMTRPFADFIHPDDLQATLDEVDKQAKTGQLVFNFQNRYRHADGSYRWLEWTSRPDYASNLMFAVARDISQRKDAEEIIANYSAHLERTVGERTAELEQARWETLRCLALAAEYRDDQTYEHTQQVGRTSEAIAEQLDLDPEFCQLIRHASPLHDVGKVGIPDSILLKPAKLTPAEFALVREHAAAGARILSQSSSELLKLAEEIALTHHEWWDGTGYPNGLSGTEIPLCGRIVAVADVFDALTHERPYKSAWTIAESLHEMRRLTGHQFDPSVMEAFEELDHEQLAGRAPEKARRILRAVS